MNNKNIALYLALPLLISACTAEDVANTAEIVDDVSDIVEDVSDVVDDVDDILDDIEVTDTELSVTEPTTGIDEVDTSFNWDGWKVTMPVNGDTYYSNTSSAAEIQPGGCTDDTFDEVLANDYFWSDNEGVHFKVPMNLDGKTPNTSYIRSELRELYDWSACETTSEANWAYGGKHSLTATLRIDDYDADSTKVVVGQIHGHDVSYATIKLHWEGNDKPIRVIYNETPLSSSSESVNLGYVDASDFWTYNITMTDEGIELTAGGVTQTLEFGDELNNAWKSETFYFKAGLYPQHSPDDSSTEIYEATFSEVYVIHPASDSSNDSADDSTEDDDVNDNGYIATASSDDGKGNVAANAIDDDLDTRWSGEGTDAWLQLDLGSEQQMDAVQIAWYKGDERKSYFSIAVSDNAQDWTTIVSSTESSGSSSALESFSFDTVTARYIRYLGQGNESSDWNSVTEFNVSVVE